MNKAEEFVYRTCRQSFLSLWSYANPQGKDPGKELCDILVVCAPDVIIFSVKAIRITSSGDVVTDWSRWFRRAIKSSCKQIYGAERWIRSASHIIPKDGTDGLPFPSEGEIRIHRAAVALGGKGKSPIIFGEFGKGFVHVFDEISFNILLGELDTISDFVMYLIDKENLYSSGVETLFQGAEEDLLAFYLQNSRSFPSKYTQIWIDNGLWDDFTSKREYEAKKRADKVSYVWDELIEVFGKDTLNGNLEFGDSLTDAELAIRTMALENRFSRRLLGKSFQEFIGLSCKKIVRSRIVPSPSGVVYVFLATPHGDERELRMAELVGRCFVARGLYQDADIVVGVATEQFEPGKGYSLDLAYLYKDIWTAEDQARLEESQKKFGYFVRPGSKRITEDEYPRE